MADGTRPNGDPDVKSADEAALLARLRHLGAGLDRVGASRPADRPNAADRPDANTAGMAQGLRLSAELIGGVVVGAGLGWIFDYALGTSPWGFIVLLMLGFAGGVLNVIRTVSAYSKR